MNDEPGNIFRERSAAGFDQRSRKVDASPCVLIVDPVLGSRFSLAQAVAHPGYLVKTASTPDEALCHLSQGDVSLIIVDQELAECDGIDFLVEVRGRFPATRRVLVTTSESASFIRGAIGRAGLCFLLSKPWSPSSLRKTIREVLGGGMEFKGWNRPLGDGVTSSVRQTRGGDRRGPAREYEVLLRGLLAGLNSCEFEEEVFELLRAELTVPFRVSEWLWVDEVREMATRIIGECPVERDLPLAELAPDAHRLLLKSRSSTRVTRLDDEYAGTDSDPTRATCVGLTIRDGSRRTRTCLIWAERRDLIQLVSMMRELQAGLQLVFRRIRLADARTGAARRLAQHVSEQLKTPVGALTHAIDRLRGEAKRAGMSTEWVDRVSSESERVVRAVEELEGEMRTDGLGMSQSTG